jgi:hypothetical protein
VKLERERSYRLVPVSQLTSGKVPVAQIARFALFKSGEHIKISMAALGTRVIHFNRLTNRWTPAKLTTVYRYDPAGNLTNVVYPTITSLVSATTRSID